MVIYQEAVRVRRGLGVGCIGFAFQGLGVDHLRKPLLALFMVAAVGWARPRDAAAQDDYGSAFAAAAALEAEGRYAAAADRLEPLVDYYPQDYALALELAWLYFEAGDYGAAESSYRRAAALSDGSRESRLGLAWTFLRQGRRGEAEAAFEAVLTQWPDDESAAEGLALARSERAPLFRPWVWATGHAYGDHPDVTWAFSLAAGATGVAFEHLFLGAAYRFDRFVFETTRTETMTSPGPGPGSGMTTRRTIREIADQHEVYASIGPTFPFFDAIFRYALLTSGDPDLENVHIAGFSGRLSPLGDISLDVTASFYTRRTIWRIAPAWRVPVGSGLSVRPGMAVQVIEGEVLWSGNLTLTLQGEPGAIWIGGRGGREERPADLNAPAVYNLAGELRFGAWLGGRVNVGDWILFGGYEMAGVEVDDGTVVRKPLAHWFGLGTAVGF